MAPCLFLLFNHKITPFQEKDARVNLGVGRIVEPPEEIARLWRRIPPDLENIEGYLSPIREWFNAHGEKGDFILIQGDFGACFLMVKFAFENGFVPVYSTTEREAVEADGEDGSVMLTHRFKHRIFRRYECDSRDELRMGL